MIIGYCRESGNAVFELAADNINMQRKKQRHKYVYKQQTVDKPALSERNSDYDHRDRCPDQINFFNFHIILEAEHDPELFQYRRMRTGHFHPRPLVRKYR